MAMRINPPVLNLKSKTYEGYKKELEAWREVTDVPKSKQGLAVALSLPEDMKVREQVFDDLKIEDLKMMD